MRRVEERLECLYSLQDASHKIFNCRVLDQLGRMLRAEDQPRFCEHCPIRLNAIRFLYMPPPDMRHGQT